MFVVSAVRAGFAKAHVVLPILRGAGLIKISTIPTELLSRCPFYSAWTILSEPGTVLKILFLIFKITLYVAPFVVSETLQSIGHWLDMVYLPPQGEFCRPFFS